jgi:hypothetical protein
VVRRSDKLDDQRACIGGDEQPNALLTHYRLIIEVKKVFQMPSARTFLGVFLLCDACTSRSWWLGIWPIKGEMQKLGMAADPSDWTDIELFSAVAACDSKDG